MRGIGALRFIGGLFLFVLFAFGLAGINFGRASEPGFLSQETCADLPQNDPRRDGGCQNPEDLGMHDWPPTSAVGWVLMAIGFLILYFVVIAPLIKKDDAPPDTSPVDNERRKQR